MRTSVDTFIAAVRVVDRWTGHLDQMVRAFIFAFSIMIFVFVFTQVAVRFLLPFPLVWLPEAATFTAAYLGLWGSSTCLRVGYHLQVKVMWDILPESAGRVLGIVLQLLILVFCMFMIVYGYKMAELSRGQFSETATFPVFWMRCAMPTGGLLLAAQAITLALRDAATLLGAPDWRADAAAAS